MTDSLLRMDRGDTLAALELILAEPPYGLNVEEAKVRANDVFETGGDQLVR